MNRGEPAVRPYFSSGNDEANASRLQIMQLIRVADDA
jgi:hypothetical protein